MRVVIMGPPHSGKSTFTAGLIEHLRERQRDKAFTLSFEYLTLDITDNSLNYLLDDSNDVSRKKDVEWTNENASQKAEEFEDITCTLVIADAPGKQTEQLDIVIEPADAAVILVSAEKSNQRSEWREYASQHDLDIIAEITSYLSDEEANVDVSHTDGILQGSIGSVSRDDFDGQGTHAFGDPSRRVVRQVAIQLMQQAVEHNDRSNLN